MNLHLVGVREIATMLGVSRQRADQIVRTKGFPDPAVELASGRVWETEGVTDWIDAKGGREASPLAIAQAELRQLVLRGRGLSTSKFTAVYATLRQQGLANRAHGEPMTRRVAFDQAYAAAELEDPEFLVELSAGWLQDDSATSTVK